MPSTPGRRSVTDGTLVKIDDLSVTFGTGDRAVEAVRHVSFDMGRAADGHP